MAQDQLNTQDQTIENRRIDLQNRITGAKAAVSALPGMAVFDEAELQAMRKVLATVCSALRINPDSDDAQRAALTVIRHASAGPADADRLAQTVQAELIADRQMSDA